MESKFKFNQSFLNTDNLICTFIFRLIFYENKFAFVERNIQNFIPGVTLYVSAASSGFLILSILLAAWISRLEFPRPYSAKRLVLEKLNEMKRAKIENERKEKQIIKKREAEIKKKAKIMKKQEKEIASRNWYLLSSLSS